MKLVLGVSLDELMSQKGGPSVFLIDQLKDVFKSHINHELRKRNVMKESARDIGAEEVQTLFERAIAFMEGKRLNPASFVGAVDYIVQEAIKESEQQRSRFVAELMHRWGGLLSPLLGPQFTLRNILDYERANKTHSKNMMRALVFGELALQYVDNQLSSPLLKHED